MLAAPRQKKIPRRISAHQSTNRLMQESIRAFCIRSERKAWFSLAPEINELELVDFAESSVTRETGRCEGIRITLSILTNRCESQHADFYRALLTGPCGFPCKHSAWLQ
jgi:hypothetical protein